MTPKLPDLSQARILVAGDVMLDRYWYGDTARISPEAPVPIVKVDRREERPGGAANVALNIAALGGKATLLGLVGQDREADALDRQLQAADITPRLMVLQGIATVSKLRILSRHQQLLRADFEDVAATRPPPEFATAFEDELARTDAVVLSDYDKGALQQAARLIAAAQRRDIPVLVDPKQTDMNYYRGATLLKPNWTEFQSIVGTCRDDREVERKGKKLLADYDIDMLLLTRGECGMTLIRRDAQPLHLPTEAKEVFDVTGAGDTVIAVLAACLAVGHPPEQAVRLANIAAGLAVSKLGAATVGPLELRRAVLDDTEQTQTGGIVDKTQLSELVAAAKARGETVVMTNGCFDILHAGHIACLRHAKSLGDRLIVAVNDDESVRRLKGADRPFNTLDKRMTVLAALSATDWVLSFAEDTPERLIGEVLPDVLVKGGDYRAQDIAGAQAVLRNSGRVEIVPLIEGCASTDLIGKIKQERQTS